MPEPSQSSFTLALSISFDGDYDGAQDLATALEQLAKRKGGRDAMIEIHEQEASA